MLTGVKARTDPQVAYPAAKQKAKVAAVASRAGYEEWKKTKWLEVCTKTGAVASITWDREDEGARAPLSPGSAVRRRHAIHYLFVEVFGAPDEEDWAAPNFHLRLSLPRVIMDMLNIPATSKAAVITAMKAIGDAHRAKKKYDPSASIKVGRGAKALIEDYTPQAEVVYSVMESGMSLGNTVVVLNQWRRIRGLEPISYGCLQRFVSSSEVMVLEKRETIKAGSKDEGTAWAWARCQFAQQLKRQLRKGARIAAGGPAYVAADDGDDPAQAALELPIFRGAVVFADEHHRKTKLGHATKYEVRIRRGASGKIAPPEKGGVLKPKNKRMTQKFNKEARGLFMVASFRTKIFGPAAARGRYTERGTVRQSCANATARARTCLNSLGTPLSWRPTRPPWGPRGGGTAAEGP